MDLALQIEGIGVWAPGIADWSALQAILRGEAAVAESAATKPAPMLLPPAERRRAPDTVLLAAQVAAEACAMANADATTLPCVFASSQGDIAITDAMCATLASAPRELSPTKFHNSVHNAPAGYWTIATQCRRASTALSAREHSVGAGLLEAALQAMAGDEPVLLACYDGAAGATPLLQAAPHALGFAAAFVLAPAHEGAPGRALRLRRASAGAPATPWPAPNLPATLASNPSAAALALLAALAQPLAAQVHLRAAPGMMLTINLDAATA